MRSRSRRRPPACLRSRSLSPRRPGPPGSARAQDTSSWGRLVTLARGRSTASTRFRGTSTGGRSTPVGIRKACSPHRSPWGRRTSTPARQLRVAWARGRSPIPASRSSSSGMGRTTQRGTRSPLRCHWSTSERIWRRRSTPCRYRPRGRPGRLGLSRRRATSTPPRAGRGNKPRADAARWSRVYRSAVRAGGVFRLVASDATSYPAKEPREAAAPAPAAFSAGRKLARDATAA